MGHISYIDKGFVVHISHSDYFVCLEEFGSKVWCSYHAHLGPTFYRSEKAIKPIESPSRKTWDAFEAWIKSIG